MGEGTKIDNNNNVFTQKQEYFWVMCIFSFYAFHLYLWSPKTIEGLFILRRKITKFVDFMSHIKLRSNETTNQIEGKMPQVKMENFKV